MKQLFIIELTVPMESRCEISAQLKRENYERDIAEAAASRKKLSSSIEKGGVQKYLKRVSVKEVNNLQVYPSDLN